MSLALFPPPEFCEFDKRPEIETTPDESFQNTLTYFVDPELNVASDESNVWMIGPLGSDADGTISEPTLKEFPPAEVAL